MKHPLRNRKPRRVRAPRMRRWESFEHRRIRTGPGAGTHCSCGMALVPVCREVLNTMGLQMHLPAAAHAVGARQQSQCAIARQQSQCASARQQSQCAGEAATTPEREAAKAGRLALLKRINAQLDPDPVEMARRTHAEILAEEAPTF